MNLHFDYSDLKRIVFEAILLVCLGISIGLSFNYQLVKNAFEGELIARPGTANDAAEVLPVPVPLADVQALAATAVIVDARISELYAEGHLPNAISLPLDEFEAQFAPFKENYPGRSLIVYCSGYGCPDSYDLALLLIAGGYHDVMVYEGGFPEWRDAGQPVEKGAP